MKRAVRVYFLGSSFFFEKARLMEYQHREKLVRDLTNLYPPQLATVKTLAGFPAAYQPGASAPHAEHASALIYWAESLGGCGLVALEDFLKQVLTLGVETGPTRGRLIGVPPRNDFFTGREEILSSLHATLKTEGRAAIKQAISGLGGVGKTATAIEYAHRHREAYSRVLWTGAESESALTSGFAALAPHLGLPFLEKADDQVAAVRTWLADNPGWLLVLDNADAPEVVKPFLPNPLTGAVLLTSRATNFATLTIAQTVALGVMPTDEALDFLRRRTGRSTPTESEADAAAALAAELGYLPLALEQAAAYVAKNRVPFAKYLEIYRARRLEILKKSPPETGDYRLTVETTWGLNFEQVEAASPAAADVLRMSAFCAPEAIPFAVVEKGATEISAALAEALAQAAIVNEVLAPLTDYSLVAMDGERETFEIHRTVQEVIKQRMDNATRRVWVEKSARATNAAFPESEFENWESCEQLLPHGAEIIKESIALDLHSFDVAHLSDRTGNFLEDRGQYAEAEHLFLYTQKIREQLLGIKHPLTAESLRNTARVCRGKADYAQAERLYERALAIDEQFHGSDSLSVATDLIGLADIYDKQRRYEELGPLLKRALHIRERELGPDHPATVFALGELGFEYYYRLERYADAQPLLERAVAIRKKTLGAKHPSLAYSLNILAMCYEAQNRCADAEKLYKRALAIREKAVGKEHPGLAFILDNLGSLYRSQSRYALAERLHRRALAIRERALGENCSLTVQTLNDLANVYREAGKYAKTESLYKRSIKIQESMFGLEHPKTAIGMYGLAKTYVAQNRYKAAELLYKRVLDIDEKTYGTDHPEIATDLEGLAHLYNIQCQYDSAGALYKRALVIRKRALGESHPKTESVAKSLAQVQKMAAPIHLD
jgi:tetratricopeptide (TPR) repeat protein